MTSKTELPTIEVTIAAPVAIVWQSLRDPELIKRWHGWHFPDLDNEISLIFGNPESVDEANHVLVAGGSDRFELMEVPEGTTVRITRPPYVPDEEWSAYYDDITEGWTSFLQQLKFMHEVHPGEDRRTIFLMARGSADGLPTRWSWATTESAEDQRHLPLKVTRRRAGLRRSGRLRSRL